MANRWPHGTDATIRAQRQKALYDAAPKLGSKPVQQTQQIVDLAAARRIRNRRR